MFALATLLTLTLPALADELPSAGPSDTRELLQSVDRELDRDIMDVVVSEEGVYLAFAERITFDTNSAVLSPDQRRAVRRMARTLRRHPDLKVQVEGHADERPVIDGPYDHNQELSLARALAVHDALTRHGVASWRLQAIGAAEGEPRAANAPVAMQLNRRAEVRIVPALDPDVLEISAQSTPTDVVASRH